MTNKRRVSQRIKHTNIKKRQHFSDTKKGYITFVILGIALFAFLLASGFANSINPIPNGTKYILATPTPYGGYNSLELHTLGFISVQPTISTVPLDCGASINLHGTKREPENIWSYMPQPGIPAVNGGKIAFWYHDENAMTLGDNPPAMKNSPIDSIFPSQPGIGVGNVNTKDPLGFYVYPGLYLLDLTQNPNGQPMDAITAGAPHIPDAVYGTWKSYNVPGNPTQNNQSLPSGADPFPGSGTIACPPTQDDCFYGSEVVWNVNTLNLTSSHDYLGVFMVHDGDNSSNGSDIGTACVTIHYQ